MRLRGRVDLRIVDDAGREVTRGASGEVLVRGPNVTPGYYRLPEVNAETFRDGWFRTERRRADGPRREQIGGLKIPRRFAYAGALPKSALGKVLKAELRAKYGGSPA